MEYRKINQDEFLALRRIHSLVYFMKYDEEKTDSFPGADENRWKYGRAAFNDEGRMVAVLEAIPFKSYLDGQVVGSPGIAGVATLVEDRRKGHVKKLLQLIFNEMHENGDVMSYLYPFSHEYYRMFGYAQGSESKVIEVDIKKVIMSSHDGYIKQYIPGDSLDDIIKVYDGFSKNYNCSVFRKDWRWNRLFSDDPYKTDIRVLVKYDNNNNPVAYLKLKKREVAEYTYDMIIIESAWTGDEGIMALISIINSFRGDLRKVRIEVPADFPISLFVNEVWDQVSTVHHTGMNRIIDASKALEIIRKPEKSGRAVLGLDDEYCPWNTGRWSIEWEKGTTSVQKTDKLPDILCKAPEFSQLVTGRYSISDLKNFKKVEINKNEDTLNSLFVRKPCFIQDRF
ncbi:MAG: GNAT family N-acetyltransferase [Clostridia bacterium]|nr:GNAT family N-acetyltransferase [Clostridia bacterium]MBN2882856.1 GNAT family N-acetyltransferase [Clostridia bacterium]